MTAVTLIDKTQLIVVRANPNEHKRKHLEKLLNTLRIKTKNIIYGDFIINKLTLKDEQKSERKRNEIDLSK